MMKWKGYKRDCDNGHNRDCDYDQYILSEEYAAAACHSEPKVSVLSFLYNIHNRYLYSVHSILAVVLLNYGCYI